MEADNSSSSDEMEQAMMALVPPGSCLQHALTVCPDVVLSETNPRLFLRFEQFHVVRAAHKLVQFWDTRVELFGSDRAFRSIVDLTGEGALQDPALALVLSGVVVFLAETDALGNSVGFWDRSAVPEHIETSLALNDRLCVAFYNFSLMMKANPNFVMIYRPFWNPTPAFTQSATNNLLEVFPVRIHRVHVVAEPPQSASWSFRMYLVTVLARMTMFFNRRGKVTIDVGSKEEILQKLLSYGFAVDNLPESIGGTSLVRDSFSQWASEKLTNSTSTGDGTEEGCDALLLLAEAAELEQTSSEFAAPARPKNGSAKDSSTGGSNSLGAGLVAESIMPAYTRAHDAASALVAKEGSLATFLSIVGGDSDAARERTEAYWAFRETAFRDRPHLPLQLSPGGALSLTDHQVLGHGYVTLLPPDANGRPVLCCDASRLERDYTVECLHCFWYMLLAAAEAATKSESVVLLIVMNKLSFERTRWHPDLVTLLRLAPLRFEIHVVRQPARLGEKVFTNKVVPVVTNQFDQLKTKIQFHSGTRACSLMDQLKPHGFLKDNLPRSLGGGWSYEHFMEWCTRRKRQESGMQPFTVPSETTRGFAQTRPSMQ